MRILIADDEPLARARLRQLLAAEPDAQIVAECEDGDAALAAITEHAPDLVLLDVQMPGLDGFEVVERLGTPRPAIIFVTAHGAHAVRAFDVHAVDYLLKPFEAERLADAMARVRRGREPEPDLRALLAELRHRPVHLERVAVRVGDRIFYVKLSEVDWIEAAGNYVRLHVKQTSHLLRRTLSAFADELDPARFVRIHRSAIVSLDAIKEMRPRTDGDYDVTLLTGHKLRLSQRYRDLLP